MTDYLGRFRSHKNGHFYNYHRYRIVFIKMSPYYMYAKYNYRRLPQELLNLILN